MDWFKIGKGVLQGCILSPCLFNLCTVYIMRNAGLDEAQAGIKIAGRNINNLRYAGDTTFFLSFFFFWWSKGVLLNSVRVYIPVASLDKDQETRLYKFTKEAKSNRGHRPRGDPYQRGFTGGPEVKASACNAGDLGSIPGSGRSPGEENGNPFQYSCLENLMDGGARWGYYFNSRKQTGTKEHLDEGQRGK